MLRHRGLHERPEVRPRMLVKRPASPEPPNLDHPIILQEKHEFTVLSFPTVRAFKLIYYQRTRKPEYYI
jgi:hypothetical protein